VQVDGANIGAQAARILMARCRGESMQERIIDVGFQIVERESTGG